MVFVESSPQRKVIVVNLTLLKELEDVKKKQDVLTSRLAKKIEAKVERSIIEAFHDFERFFKDNGFEVQADERIITASYGNLKAILKYDVPATPHVGSYFVFDLIFEMQETTEYQLLLISKDKNTDSSCNTAKDSDQPLRQHIEKVKENIGSTEDRIKNFTKEIWAFELRSKKQKKKDDRIIHDSVYELLTALTTEDE